MGEVKVSLVVDDSKARQTVQSFFDSIGNEKIADPFKGLDKSLDQITQSAKQLGLTWDKTSQSFKDQSGASKTIEQVGAAIKKVDGEAKATGKSFSEVAKQFKTFDQAASTAAKGVKGFGSLMKQTGQEIKAANFTKLGQQLKNLGGTAQTAGSGFKQLGTDAKGASTQLKGIGKGLDSGIKSLGVAADKSAQDLKDLGTAGKTADGQLKNIGRSSGALKTLGSNAQNAAKGVGQLKTQGTQAAQALQNVSNGGKGLNAVSSAAKNIGSTMSGAAKGANTLATATGKLGKNSTSIKSLGHAVTGLSQSTTRAATGFGSLGAAINTANQKAKPLSALPTKIKPINAAMQSAGKAADAMGKELEEAGKEGGQAADTIVEGFKQIVIGIPQGIGIALGNALLAPLKELVQIIPKAVEEFRQLDESIRLTLEISGAGAGKFQELQAAILAVSSTSAATAAEVGAVAQSLARAGFTLDETKAAMDGVIKGAEATGTAYEAMGDIVVSALGAFQLAAGDAGKVADSLVVAANNSNQSVLDLGESLKYVGPVAYAVGQSLDDVNLALGLLANAGIKASSAGTSLRTLLTNLKIAAGGASEEFTTLSRGNARFAKALRLLGSTVTDVNGELLPMKQLLLNLQQGFNGMTSAQQAFIAKALVGQEGLSAFSALMKSSTTDVIEFADKLENAGGTAVEQAGNALKGLSGSFKLLESAASAALVQIGGMVATVLKPLVDVATGLINVFNGLPGPIKAVAGAVVGLGVAVGVLTAGLALMENAALAAFAGKVITAITNFTAAFNAANAAKAMSLMLDKATALTNALNGGLTGALNGATKGLQALGNAIKNPSQTIAGLSQAAGNATQWLKGLGGAAAPAAGQLGKMGVSAAQAAQASATMGAAFSKAAPVTQALMISSGKAAGTITAAGVASAGATGGVAGLGAAMGSLMVTIAPIAAVVGGIVLAVKGVSDYYAKWREVSSQLEGTTKGLNDALKKNGEAIDQQAEKSDYLGRAIDTLKGKNSSWGKSMEDALGPFDRAADVVFPVLWKGIKKTADLMGQLDEANKMRTMVAGLNDDYNKFTDGLDKTQSAIDKNNAAMLRLNPTSERYGQLLGKNRELLTQSVGMTQQRIKQIDELIKKYTQEEGANSMIVQALQRQRGELQANLVQQELQKKAMEQQAQAYQEATGKVDSHTAAIAKLEQEQAKMEEAFDSDFLINQVALHDKVREGILSEAEAKAATAGAVLDHNRDIIDSENERLRALEEAYAEGEITEADYAKKKEEIVGKIKERTKELIETEKAYTEAVRAAVTERLDEYLRAQQGVADFANKVNQILGSINSVGTSGIAAFKNLANEITNGRLAGIDRVKDKEIKAIDEQSKKQIESIDRQREARLAMIDRSSMSDEQKQKAKEAAEKQFQRQKESAEQKAIARREAAEREAERKKKAALQEQISFEEKAHQATMTMKQAQLAIDERSAQLQNDLAIVQIEVEKEKARLRGAPEEELAAYDRMKGLLEANRDAIRDTYDMKRDILDVEDQIGKHQIANKAAAGEVNSIYSNMGSSLSGVESQMDGFVRKWEDTSNAMESYYDNVEIQTGQAEQVVTQTMERIEGAWNNFDTQGARDAMTSLFGPELGKEMADKLTGYTRDAATEAGEVGRNTLMGFFGDAIPYELLKEPLIRALSDGSEEGRKQAEAKLKELATDGVIPTEQIATILGRAVGGGYEEGLDIIKTIPLPEELAIYSDLEDALKQAFAEGVGEGGELGAKDVVGLMKTSAEESSGAWDGAFAEWAQNLQKSWNSTMSDIGNAWNSLFENDNTEQVGSQMEQQLIPPIDEAQTKLSKLSINQDLGNGLNNIATDAQTVANSGIKSEMGGAATASKSMQSSSRNAASSVRSMVSTSRQTASNMERAARAAQTVARSRFTGGPVQGGQSYIVNELGSEMFLSNSGRLSEINAPAFGNWRAPSSGTVIPAGIAQEVRDAQEAMQVGVDVQAAQGSTTHRRSSTHAHQTGPNYQKQMVKELQNLNQVGGSTVNNVTVTSERPIGDAQRLLLEVNRMNNYRRRR